MKSEAKRDSKYFAPKLMIYGDLAKLTASGAGSKTETTGQPSRKP